MLRKAVRQLDPGQKNITSSTGSTEHALAMGTNGLSLGEKRTSDRRSGKKKAAQHVPGKVGPLFLDWALWP